MRGRLFALFLGLASACNQSGTLNGVSYDIDLPIRHELSKSDELHHWWSPGGGEGLTVMLSVKSPVPQRDSQGAELPVECASPGEMAGFGTVPSNDPTISGPRIIVGHVCTASRRIMCSVSHSRGHVLTEEEGAARALCETLRVRDVE